MHRSEFSDDEDMRELIELYVNRLPEEVARLEAMINGSDLEAIRKLAHQIKGSGGGYGFPRITELAAIIDHSVKQGAPIEQVNRETQDLIEYLRVVDGYNAEGERSQTTNTQS